LDALHFWPHDNDIEESDVILSFLLKDILLPDDEDDVVIISFMLLLLADYVTDAYVEHGS